MITITSEYVAGFFDGEGSISIYQRSQGGLRLGVQITQHVRNAAVMSKIQKMYGGHWGEYVNNKGTPFVMLTFHHSAARGLLAMLAIRSQTYKKDLAKIALRMLDLSPGRGYRWDPEHVEEIVNARDSCIRQRVQRPRKCSIFFRALKVLERRI